MEGRGEEGESWMESDTLDAIRLALELRDAETGQWGLESTETTLLLTLVSICMLKESL